MATIASYNKRLEALRSERSSFIPLYMELSDYHLAHRGRFLLSDRNKGHKRNTKQYNNTSRMAARTLSSGMMAGITSPARPWFKLQASDPQLNEASAVKQWLHDVQTIMYRVFAQSNTYNALHTLYSELGVFGTSPMGIFHNFQNVIRCKPYTVGSYMIASNGLGEIDTFYREYEITVAECVRQFGIDNCSQTVKQAWKTGNTEMWIAVVHLIEPNDDRDSNSPLAKDKKYRSVYYEVESAKASEQDLFLRRSGFDQFPVMCPRWDITGEDIYATDCPGMIALGDTKALQLGEKRSYQAVDKVSNPTLQGPVNLLKRIRKAGVGEHIPMDQGSSDTLSSVYGNWRPDIKAIEMKIEKAEDRIRRAFYEDLFLMLANSDRRQITAREVAEKHEEKLLMLGPVLERLHSELLDPLIDRTFHILQRAGVLPRPPRELDNTELTVQYVSVLAQAQRMVATTGLERLAGFAGEISAIWPEARHKFNAQQAIDDYADSIGTNPSVIRSDDQAEEMAASEAQARQAAAMGMQAEQAAKTAKTASEVDVENVSDMMRQAGLQ